MCVESDLVDSLIFVAATELVIQSEALLREAVRCEQRNPAWARNRRRQANKLLATAKSMCGP